MITNERLMALMLWLNAEVEAGAEYRSGHQAHHVSVFFFDGAGHVTTVQLGCYCIGCLQGVADAAIKSVERATDRPQAMH